MNVIYLKGKITQDAKSGMSKNGTGWASASMATSKKSKDEFITTFHNIYGFKHIADLLAKCKKGDEVFVSGELQHQEYEKDGVKKIATKVLINHFVKGDKTQLPETSQPFSASDDEIPF